MNSHEINKLIEDALNGGAASDAFKAHLLRDSTAVLVRSRSLQRQLRSGVLTLMILVVTAAAFVFGRLSASSRSDGQQTAVQTVGDKNDGVRVSRDLVVWLDAARFFTHLGMDKRAALSYKKASELIPHDMSGSQQAGLGPQSVLAGILRDFKTADVFSKESFERADSPQAQSSYCPKLELSITVPNNIITQHFGG